MKQIDGGNARNKTNDHSQCDEPPVVLSGQEGKRAEHGLCPDFSTFGVAD
jgi:hypothetical protein